MTLEEAKKICAKCKQYVCCNNNDDVCLDGDFTINELESIICILQHEHDFDTDDRTF